MAKMTTMEEFKNLLPKNGEVADEDVLARSQIKLKEELMSIQTVVEEGNINYKRFVVNTSNPNTITPVSKLRIADMTSNPNSVFVNGVALDTTQYLRCRNPRHDDSHLGNTRNHLFLQTQRIQVPNAGRT